MEDSKGKDHLFRELDEGFVNFDEVVNVYNSTLFVTCLTLIFCRNQVTLSIMSPLIL